MAFAPLERAELVGHQDQVPFAQYHHLGPVGAGENLRGKDVIRMPLGDDLTVEADHPGQVCRDGS